MDEEEHFARLLSQSTPAPRPSLYSTASDSADPWANPFSADAGWGGSEPSAPAPAAEPPRPSFESFGGAAKPAFDGFGGTPPDPPSVIHAREREELAGAFGGGGFGGDGGFATTVADTYRPPQVDTLNSTGGFDGSDPYDATPYSAGGFDAAASPTSPQSPSTSTKPPSQQTSPQAQRHLPAGLIDEDLLAENDPEASLKRAFVKTAPEKADKQAVATPEKPKPYVFRPGRDKPAIIVTDKPSAPKPGPDTDPRDIPLPESGAATPTASRSATPVVQQAAASSSPLAAPTPGDRVSVSPLETPGEPDYGFQSLAIGGNTNGVSDARGRGWAAIEEDGPLSGTDPWGGNNAAWGGEEVTQEQGPESGASSPAREAPMESPLSTSSRPGMGTPRRSKLLNTPVFQITVSDPTKVGDPVRGHVVYTVRTKTTSPHYRRGEFSVLRRFSDFLWLFEALTANNPGVIVPPVPDKHAFGRFQEQFIETRRAALQRCLGKITAHPILQLDPDLRLFLESDSFAMDIKGRRGDAQPSTSLLASWTGPKYTEKDDWFDHRKAYLDHLETGLKALSKSLETASKARLDMAAAVGDVADAAAALADSDLGAAMCAALARLAELARAEKAAGEAQATSDVTHLLNLADEYVRFITSVRLAFASRVRAYHTWQAAEKELLRIRQARDKARVAGRLADRGTTSMAEIGEADRRARDASADFEGQSRLVKAEFARFERERVDEFRRTLAAHLDAQIGAQRQLVKSWEEYHSMLLKMVQRVQQQRV